MRFHSFGPQLKFDRSFLWPDEYGERAAKRQERIDALSRPPGQGPVKRHHGPTPSGVLYVEFTSRSHPKNS